jgi:hypothetical protein
MSDAPPPRLAPKPPPRLAHTRREPAEAPPSHRRAFADALARHGGKPRGKNPFDEAPGALSATATPREFAALATAEARPIAGDVDLAFQANLDRIAAAIAEFAANGAEPEVHLALPAGSKVEGAVLGRDLAGQINVLLIPSTAVPPALAAQWTEQLQERLVRRELRVGKLSVQSSARRAVSPA